MKTSREKKLEANGWKTVTVSEFLNLTQAEDLQKVSKIGFFSKLKSKFSKQTIKDNVSDVIETKINNDNSVEQKVESGKVESLSREVPISKITEQILRLIQSEKN